MDGSSTFDGLLDDLGSDAQIVPRPGGSLSMSGHENNNLADGTEQSEHGTEECPGLVAFKEMIAKLVANPVTCEFCKANVEEYAF